METSGLILDVYDDFKGNVLRSLYPTSEAIPDFVKTAQVLSAEDRQRLPDDAFALVMQNGEAVLRKFACIDEGNTVLSVQYFLQNAHKLPEEAQKTAAQNLVTACGWYDIAVPEPLSKIADITGTTCMPYQAPTDKKVGGEKAVIKRANIQPHVDVTTKTASRQKEVTKTAQYYALPSQKKYPLDTYVQIKTASQYFEDFYKDFKPEHRHEYAANLLKRANAVGLTMTDLAKRYGSLKYASHGDLEVAYEVRDKACAWDDNARSMLHELFEKRAELEPEVFARALGEFDKTAGLSHLYDSHIPDPFFSTFGFEKTANEMEVDEMALRKLAKKLPAELQEKFASDFCEEFQRDPVGIFQSMPSEQQQILRKMANEAA